MNPPNTIASDTLVEAIARAMVPLMHPEREDWAGNDLPATQFDDMAPDWQARHLEYAQAALTAITEAGYAVVQVEPTEAMTVFMAEAVEAATEIIADGNFDRPARLQALAAHAAFIDAATNNGKAE